MAWNQITWRCGHSGRMQLYGKMSKRESRIAYESGQNCMVCWLIDQWKQKEDPRFNRADCKELAAKIARGKGIEIIT